MLEEGDRERGRGKWEGRDKEDKGMWGWWKGERGRTLYEFVFVCICGRWTR